MTGHADPTRRTILGHAAGAGVLVTFPNIAFGAETTLLSRTIPHGHGETIPVVGVGTAKVFDVGDDATKRKILANVVRTLVEGGGSLIDTASSYGTSEEVVGAVATGTPLRQKFFIATKLEARGGREASNEFATSLKRLRVEKVDLIQMHNVSAGDPGLAFFRDLQARGLARYVGATTTFADDYDAMEKLIKRDRPDFIEIDCSIANRESESRIIPAAAEVGAAVLIALPFGRSSLFKKVKGKPLPPIAQEIGATTWGQVFLKYLLGNPAITAVIPGTGDPEHMADNLAAGRGPMPDAKQRQALVSYFEGLG